MVVGVVVAGRGVAVLVLVAVAVLVGVFVGVLVLVGVLVSVGVLLGTLVAVGTSVGVLLGTLVGVGTSVGVLLGTLVGVGTSVGVLLGTLVAVLVAVGVLVGNGVSVAVRLGSAVGETVTPNAVGVALGKAVISLAFFKINGKNVQSLTLQSGSSNRLFVRAKLKPTLAESSVRLVAIIINRRRCMQFPPYIMGAGDRLSGIEHFKPRRIETAKSAKAAKVGFNVNAAPQ